MISEPLKGPDLMCLIILGLNVRLVCWHGHMLRHGLGVATGMELGIDSHPAVTIVSSMDTDIDI